VEQLTSYKGALVGIGCSWN